jgi:hypothetical protein
MAVKKLLGLLMPWTLIGSSFFGSEKGSLFWLLIWVLLVIRSLKSWLAEEIFQT